MSRTTSLIAIVLLMLFAVLVVPVPPDRVEPAPHAPAREPLWKALDRRIDFKGADRASLKDLLDFIDEQYEVPISVHERAFRARGFEGVLDTQITVRPLRNGSLRTLLRLICREITSDTIWVVTDDSLELTTGLDAAEELRRPLGTSVSPLVNVAARTVPLRVVLRDIAEQSGLNVVVDPRAARQADDSTVTVRLRNVPAETAVRTLAAFADLGVACGDGVLAVTTPDRVKALARELNTEAERIGKDCRPICGQRDE